METNKTLWLILIIQLVLTYFVNLATFTFGGDMIENILWGRTLDFSSDKHPPFFGWEAFLSVKFAGGSFWFYKMLTPIHQAFLFLFTFLLAKEIFNSEKKALLCVIFSAGIIVHLFYFKFNANSANYGFFGAIYYLFYLACFKQKKWLFIVVGFLCAITMLIKYSAIIMIGCLWLTIFATKEGREMFKSPFLYLGILVFLGTLTPYILSILQTENYGAFGYLSENSLSMKMRWYEVPKLVLLSIAFCIPFLIAFFKVKEGVFIKSKINNFTGIFLLINAFLPFLLTIFYIIFTNSQVGSFWLCMFFSLFPIMAVYFFEIKENAIKLSAKIIFPLMFLIYLVHLISQILASEYDVEGIGKFTKEKTEGIDYFICNEERRVCGMALIYGTDYENTKMTISKWQNPFEEVNKMKEKPSKIAIIGDGEEITLEGYYFEKYEQEFPQYFKFRFIAENKILAKRQKSTKIIITIATLNKI
jgi:4-amino-4-deoxy-L-arabinose transferase-like glycosyltransferase